MLRSDSLLSTTICSYGFVWIIWWQLKITWFRASFLDETGIFGVSQVSDTSNRHLVGYLLPCYIIAITNFRPLNSPFIGCCFAGQTSGSTSWSQECMVWKEHWFLVPGSRNQQFTGILVGGLEHDFYDIPFSWECHHPNWRTHIFQRGRYTTNQDLFGNAAIVFGPRTFSIDALVLPGKTLNDSVVVRFFGSKKANIWMQNGKGEKQVQGDSRYIYICRHVESCRCYMMLHTLGYSWYMYALGSRRAVTSTSSILPTSHQMGGLKSSNVDRVP